MSVLIDGREYDSHAEWLSEEYGTDPEAYQYPVLITTETTYLIWSSVDRDQAKPGETPDQQAVRELDDSGCAYELLDGNKNAVDGSFRVEPFDYDWLSRELGRERLGPKLPDGQWESEHARQLWAEHMEQVLAKRGMPGSRAPVRTVELPAEDVPV